MKRKPIRTTATAAFSKVKEALEHAIAYHTGQGRLTVRDKTLKRFSPASAKTRAVPTSTRKAPRGRAPARSK